MKYVFYHAACYDGFGAAFSAWMKFGKSAKYIPIAYGKQSVFDETYEEDDEVYILDFAIPNDEFEELLDLVAKVVILDHHKTALERFTEMSPFPSPAYELKKDKAHVLFDMNRSGALISWEYFHPEKPVPRLIKWISDRDLWRFQFSETKAVHALLTSKKMDFEIWAETMSSLENALDLLKKGEAILEVQGQTVDMICRKSYMTNIAGHMVPVVNATSHWSEVGYKLLEMYPNALFAASYGDQPDGTRMYSLRSKDEFDVSVVALLFGGGGHKNAAGFKVPFELQLDALTLEKKDGV